MRQKDFASRPCELTSVTGKHVVRVQVCIHISEMHTAGVTEIPIYKVRKCVESDGLAGTSM